MGCGACMLIALDQVYTALAKRLKNACLKISGKSATSDRIGMAESGSLKKPKKVHVDEEKYVRTL
jgi:hypothetical protein